MLQKSSNALSLMKQLKEGLIAPEEALNEAFPDPYVHIKDISVDALKVEVLPSGFRVFDEHFVLKRGRPQLVTIAAYTSHGKSAMLLQLAANVAKHGPVFVHSFEMEEKDLKSRLLAPRINVPLERIMRDEIPSEKLHEADIRFESLNLHLCSDPNTEVTFMEQACIQKAKKVGNPLMIVADYLQFMKGPMNRGESKRLEIGDILQRLRSLSYKMKCPIVMGSQMNRNCELRGKGIEREKGVGEYRPIMSDLSEASTIGHDSDVVFFITRQEQYDGRRPGEADILCVKNRGGKTFESRFQWSGALCSFYEARGI